MKNQLVKLLDNILLRKRSLIETVNDQLKHSFQIEHSLHRSPFNFLVNTLAALGAYPYQEKKPALELEAKGLDALPPSHLLSRRTHVEPLKGLWICGMLFASTVVICPTVLWVRRDRSAQ